MIQFRGRAAKVLTKWLLLPLYQSWNSWRVFVGERHAARDIMRTFFRRLAQRFLIDAWKTWKRFVCLDGPAAKRGGTSTDTIAGAGGSRLLEVCLAGSAPLGGGAPLNVLPRPRPAPLPLPSRRSRLPCTAWVCRV